MDANGHRFWLYADAADFDLSAGGMAWQSGCLRLAGSTTAIASEATRRQALDMADLPAMTVDGFDTWAWLDPDAGDEGDAGAIVAGGAGAPPRPILAVPVGAEMRDLSAGSDGVLRVAGALGDGLSGLALIDLRGRWRDPYVIDLPDAEPDRVAEGWVMERTSGRIWVERGIPIADFAIRARAGHVFRPRPEYANPPRLEELAAVEKTSAERIADCAARPDGLLAVLVLSAAQGRRARVVFVRPDGERSSAEVPVAGFPGAIGWVSETRLALIYPDAPRALALDVGDDLPDALTVAAARYPLKGEGPRRLCRGTVLPVHVVRYEGRRPGTPRPLHPISLPGYATTATATAAIDTDGGEAGFTWHRVVVEGDFPPGTSATVAIRAADATGDLAAAVDALHHVGAAPDDGAPRAAWIEEPSELPFHPGLVDAEPVPDRRGCFVALVQRADTVSREVRGRYARISVTLRSNGQVSPRVWAVRLYGGRFSLVRNYMPAVFHPPVEPVLAETPGAAHPRDFAERYVAMFECVLTRLEDKIAAAHLLTDPHAAPEDALDWLACWVGLSLDTGLSDAERRAMLANAIRLHRRRGTVGGLRLALDLASSGEVSRGGIVALEDFRLRRVFATILGAELGTEYDPLLAGPIESGNSFVGPTLHLGDAEELDAAGQTRLSAAQETELAALFRAPDDRAAADAVRGFFEQLAYRVTVLVHADIGEDRFRTLANIARTMTPAHVALSVERASKPLILGLYSLLGVDTYLCPRPGPTPVRVGSSVLGEKDFVLRLPSLDPRLEQGDAP